MLSTDDYFALWSSIQFGPVYTLVQYTVWSSIHFGPVYTLVQYTLWSSIHFGPVYSLVQYTVWSSIHFGPVYSLVQYTLWSSIHFGPVYTLVQYTFITEPLLIIAPVELVLLSASETWPMTKGARQTTRACFELHLTFTGNNRLNTQWIRRRRLRFCRIILQTSG